MHDFFFSLCTERKPWERNASDFSSHKINHRNRNIKIIKRNASIRQPRNMYSKPLLIEIVDGDVVVEHQNDPANIVLVLLGSIDAWQMENYDVKNTTWRMIITIIYCWWWRVQTVSLLRLFYHNFFSFSLIRDVIDVPDALLHRRCGLLRIASFSLFLSSSWNTGLLSRALLLSRWVEVNGIGFCHVNCKTPTISLDSLGIRFGIYAFNSLL